jgi:hypothetical protein
MQIAESIRDFGTQRQTTDVVDDGEGRLYAIVQEHQGIETTPDELEEIFESYFPNLHRRSALIIIFSFLEHQLDQLCELFATTRKLDIVVTDLKDKGINRSRRYLKKVIRLSIDNSSVWQELKQIQKLRNVAVHNDAKLDSEEKDLIHYVDKAIYLSIRSNETYDYREINEVSISEGYLQYVLEIINSYCGELNAAIQNYHDE